MGTAVSTTNIMPAKKPQGSKQEPLASFMTRHEKLLLKDTDGWQKHQLPATANAEDEDEDPGSPPSSQPTSGSCIRRRSSRAASKLKRKAHSISNRIAQKTSSRSQSGMEDELANQRSCAQQVVNLFPDISLQHLRDVSTSHGHDADAVINFIVDELDAGRSYPKENKLGATKRKRGHDDEDEDNDEDNEEMARVKRRYDSAGLRAVRKPDKHVTFM